MKEFYTTEGENQQHAFSNCHIVGELRSFHEIITCSILAIILGLFKNNSHLFIFINISLILLRTKLKH